MDNKPITTPEQIRINELFTALMQSPMGQELKNLLTIRLAKQGVFQPTTDPMVDKWNLGRHSVYQELIRMADAPLKPPQPEKENDNGR